MKINGFLAQSSPANRPSDWPFVKMHGLENYFVILDRRAGDKFLDVETIVRICDPNIGVGGEQLLTIEAPSERGRREGAYAAMRIFNIDGQEVGACGNATRCMAHLLLEETGKQDLLLELADGVVQCCRDGAMSISVTLGPVSLDWRKIPLAHEADTLKLPIESGPLIDGVASYIGNPHVTFFVDSLAETDMARFAPPVQNHELFSESVNVGVAEVVDRQTLRLAVWERPGVLTRACGTGACVAAYAAVRRGFLDTMQVAVDLPAGRLDIELSDDDMVIMTGPVAYCCTGFVEGSAQA